MISTLFELPTHLRLRLVSALDAGALTPPYGAFSVRSVLGVVDGETEISAALLELGELGVSGHALAEWLRTIEQQLANRPKADLVWSGPEVPGVPARDTRRVYEELMSTAQHSIWASTFAFFDGQKAFEVLARRMEAVPDLEVTLLLNIQRKWTDSTAADQLVRRFTERFWNSDWPGSARPRVFYDPRSLELGGPAGVLHAKALVCDERVVFITSANLTEAALDRNIELGLLVRDRALAIGVARQFRGLIEHGMLRPLPME